MKLKQLIAGLCVFIVLLGGLCTWEGTLLARNVLILGESRIWQPLEPQRPQSPSEQEQNKGTLVNPMGSVGLITEKTVLVSLYLELEESEWSVAEKAQMQIFLQKGLTWLENQAGNYGKRLTLVSELKDPKLQFSMKLDGEVPDGTEDIPSSFDSQVLAACNKLAGEVLTGQYEGWNIGFLILMPTAGQDFTMIYEQDYYGEYFYEYSVLYQYDIFMDAPEAWVGPTTIAHEILHQFGAFDLYEGTTDLQVTQDVIDYIDREWPDEIMYYTYEEDDSISYDGINKSISPLTAYRIGLTEELGDFAQFHEIAKSRPGIYGAGHLPGSQAA